MPKARKYKEAGQFFSDLRKEAGYASRSTFVYAVGQQFGPVLDYEAVSKLERGYREPKAMHLKVYQAITGASAEKLLSVPCKSLAPTSS